MSSEGAGEWLVHVLAPLPPKKDLGCSTDGKSSGPQRRFGRQGRNLISSVVGSYLVSISAKNECRTKNKTLAVLDFKICLLPIRHCS